MVTRFFLTLGLSDKQADFKLLSRLLPGVKKTSDADDAKSEHQLPRQAANAADSGKDHTTPDWEIPCRGSMLCLNSVISSLGVVSPIAGVKRSPYLG